MALRDYLRILRRGWIAVALGLVLGIVASAVYLAVATMRYEASASLLLAPSDARSLGDLQQGSQFAVSTAPTYADVVDSSRVLIPAAEALGGGRSASELAAAVTAESREATSIIDIVASAPSATEAAEIANAVARSATEVLPSVAASRSGAQDLLGAQVVTEAGIPAAAISPVGSRTYVIGAVLGLLLGLVFTLVRQGLDTRLRDAEDLASTPSPLLAAVPRARRRQRHAVVLRDDPLDQAVETYRALRTTLMAMPPDSRRSILVTSASRSEPGPEVAVNLAWSFAQSGRRVLLVDLDLRSSPVRRLLSIDERRGLSDLLEDPTLDLQESALANPHDDLFVLGAGPTGTRSPSDLLSTPQMERLLRRAERSFDFVVLHAPPLLSYTDASVVSRIAAHTALIVPTGTRGRHLDSSLAGLANLRVIPLGVIFTGARRSLSRSPGPRGQRVAPRSVSMDRLLKPADGPADGSTDVVDLSRVDPDRPDEAPRTEAG